MSAGMTIVSMLVWLCTWGVSEAATGSFPRVEVRFDLPKLSGNPFDYTENDVRVLVRDPVGEVQRFPAFFDGGTTWRVRFTPRRAGAYQVVGVTRSGADAGPVGLTPDRVQVSGKPGHGFVRRDPSDPRRFRFDDGAPYCPIGHNVAWGNGRKGDIAAIFDKMGRVGENWSRVWMDHWDGKNLDWVGGKKIPLGQLDLDVARRWDEIVEAAERNGIHFQMTLQHHGQYTTRVNPNWSENPWNAANGGFLASPREFFTDARAISLTQAKYRYIVARWGYSTAIMAWELFNEVEWTDAYAAGDRQAVASWHDRMATFLREQDPYRHLVTSSSGIDPAKLGVRLDYWQPHAYIPDALTAIAGVDASKLDRPVFFGEIGPSGDLFADDGSFLRRAVWGGILSECAGAAQYWAWDLIDRRDFYPLFRPATQFVRDSGLLRHVGFHVIRPAVETPEQGPLEFGPGGGWGRAGRTEFTVDPSGGVPGIGGLPAYFQGVAHREMMGPVTFHVTFARPGVFRVSVDRVARSGARLILDVDGVQAADRAFPASDRDAVVDATVEARVPAGRHTVRVSNTGADWVVVRRITLDPYAPALAAIGKATRECAALWVYRRGSGATSAPISGKLRLAGMSPGRYVAAWWDSVAGGKLGSRSITAGSDGRLAVPTPPIARDAAVFVERVDAGGGRRGR